MAFWTDTFDLIALAIRSGGDDEHSEAGGGVPQDEITDFPVISDVEGAHENIRPGLNKPALEMAPDGGRDVVAYEDGHEEEDSGLRDMKDDQETYYSLGWRG